MAIAGRRWDRRVVVAEVLPQQQRLLSLLPGKTVAVVVKVKRLPPGNKGIIWDSSAYQRKRKMERRGEQGEGGEGGEEAERKEHTEGKRVQRFLGRKDYRTTEENRKTQHQSKDINTTWHTRTHGQKCTYMQFLWIGGEINGKNEHLLWDTSASNSRNRLVYCF